MTTDYKVTELFCIIDEFCKHFDEKMQEIYLKTLPTPNGMGRRRFHAAFILYKTLGYPELRYKIKKRCAKTFE